MIVSDGQSQEIRSFNLEIKSNSPRLISPKNNSLVTIPLFKWSRINSGVSYSYRLNLYDALTNQRIYSNSIAGPTTTESSERYYLSNFNLTRGENYLWEVVGINNYNQELTSAKNYFHYGCSSNSQCGGAATSTLICSNNKVLYRKTSSPICANRGTLSSRCSTSTSWKIVDKRCKTCSNGVCVK